MAASRRGRAARRCAATRRYYFDPLSPEEMARAIAAVLDDPAAYVQRGLARARLYTWETTARTHEDVYRRLAA